MKSRKLVETLLAESPWVGDQSVSRDTAAELLRDAVLKVTGGTRRGRLGLYAYGAQIDFRKNAIAVRLESGCYGEFSGWGRPLELVLAELVAWLSNHNQAEVDRLRDIFSRAAAGKVLAK